MQMLPSSLVMAFSLPPIKAPSRRSLLDCERPMDVDDDGEDAKEEVEVITGDIDDDESSADLNMTSPLLPAPAPLSLERRGSR